MPNVSGHIRKTFLRYRLWSLARTETAVMLIRDGFDLRRCPISGNVMVVSRFEPRASECKTSDLCHSQKIESLTIRHGRNSTHRLSKLSTRPKNKTRFNLVDQAPAQTFSCETILIDQFPFFSRIKTNLKHRLSSD